MYELYDDLAGVHPGLGIGFVVAIKPYFRLLFSR